MMRRRQALQHLEADIRDHIERETADNIASACRPTKPAAGRWSGSATSA